MRNCDFYILYLFSDEHYVNIFEHKIILLIILCFVIRTCCIWTFWCVCCVQVRNWDVQWHTATGNEKVECPCVCYWTTRLQNWSVIFLRAVWS